MNPRCVFCGKFVRLFWVDETGVRRRMYPKGGDVDGIIAECRTCGQINGFMEEV